jgi:hypothetical protein
MLGSHNPSKSLTFIDKNIIESVAAKNIKDINQFLRIKKNKSRQEFASRNRNRLVQLEREKK